MNQMNRPTEGARAVARRIDPPAPPVVWLHYDYMVASDHSHAPSPEAIDRAVAAFRARGITLHVDPQSAAIPETPSLYLGFGHYIEDGCPGSPPGLAVGLYELKERYSHPHGSRAWHYAVFGHTGIASNGLCGIGGEAQLAGYDFTVTLGVFVDFPDIPLSVFRDAESGTLLHELGHNLCLHHGGACTDAHPWKPNYISVMNYLFVYPGIPYAANLGSTEPVGSRFDYSDEVLPPLDERHLDERVGVQAGTTDIVGYLCPPQPDGTFLEGVGPASGAIDWNCDGVIEADVAADLDVFTEHVSPPPDYPFYEILTGYDDWAHIHRWIRTPAYVSGTLRSRGRVP